MALQANLRHILLTLLPSPEIKLAGQQLGVSNHLDMISDILWAINSVILDANLRAAKEPELKIWLRDVTAAAVDVENTLEVIQDYYQEPKMQQKHEVTPPPPNLLHPSSISSTSSCHAILVELKHIAQSLNCLLSRAVAFDLQIDIIDSMDPNQAEYYSILQQEVIEREDDVKRILQIIFNLKERQPSKHIMDDEPFVIAITGERKIGKSILARMVYHHPLVCEIFKHRIWVDVTKCTIVTFDQTQIARECVRHLTGITSSAVDIWNLLHRSLPQTRFLLILDNILNWTIEEIDKWEELRKNLLSFGALGSRLIITCKSYPIIESNSTVFLDKEYKLKNISRDAWIKLFLRHAIPTMHLDQAKQNSPSIRMIDMLNLDIDQYDPKPFHRPMSAKLRGFISRNTPLGFDQFQEQSRRFIQFINIQYIEKQWSQLILYILLFKPLPLTLTNDCFDMLIAEGIFYYSRNCQLQLQKFFIQMMEEFHEFNTGYGNVHFAIKKSIFHFNKKNGQKFRISQQCRYLCIHVDSDTNTFVTNLEAKIANNVRMLMLYKIKKETDLQVEKYKKSSSIEIPKSLIKNLIILSIIDTDTHQLPNTISILCRLRYLNISENEIEKLPESICDLYNLHVLSLSHCKKLLKLPKKIHKLTKLHVLKLAYCTRLQKLPKTITRLVNLLVLDIEACYWLKELPEELRHLERLMNLHMIQCASLTRIPIGISKLINLEALSGYTMDDNEHGRLTPYELQSLTSIKELHLHHLECLLDPNNITSANLKEKKYLQKLFLHWEWWNMHVRENDQLKSFKVLDDLEPNVSHLESLEITSYLGMQFPNWMMMDEQILLFKSLKKIRLVNLKRCKNLPLLCRLHSLAILEMSGMDLLTCVGSTIANDEDIFPSLKKLILSEMATLAQWNLRCPYLKELTLIHCPKLSSLYGLELKRKLTIWLQSELLGQYSSSFENIFNNIKELEIVGCHVMRQLPKDIKKCERLQTLSIINCSKLLYVPDWLQEMPSLQQIFFAGCTSILYISEKLKQRLKDHIIIQGCSKQWAITRKENHLK